MFKKENESWKFKLKNHDDRIFRIPNKDLLNSYGEGFLFDSEWGYIEAEPGGLKITINPGYSWNGCNPKRIIWDIEVGTPDGAIDAHTGRPRVYYPSLVHDFLCQFEEQIPLTRAEIDMVFYRLMVEYDFAPAKIYYGMVRLFSLFSAEKEKV